MCSNNSHSIRSMNMLSLDTRNHEMITCLLWIDQNVFCRRILFVCYDESNPNNLCSNDILPNISLFSISSEYYIDGKMMTNEKWNWCNVVARSLNSKSSYRTLQIVCKLFSSFFEPIRKVILRNFPYFLQIAFTWFVFTTLSHRWDHT